MKIVQPVREAEAIGEFLKNEFYQSEYNRDRDRHEEIVLRPDYNDSMENAIRRALLYRRRGHMWRELPSDTTWFEVDLEPADLKQIRVFPRAQWRKMSNGSFAIADIVDRIRSTGYQNGGSNVIAKIQQLRYRLQLEQYAESTVLLIGVDQHQPFTILEGNHRLAAAMLVSPKVVSTRFRVLCGLSPRMAESCWYKTDVPNLVRYIRNRVLHIYDWEADLARLPLQPSKPHLIESPIANAVGGEKLSESQR
ncbi:MAG: hypothetical protein JWO13_1568 [Acidobacteriales bacterium]|nr:hypothetical protein [Terriglobales bacterium]